MDTISEDLMLKRPAFQLKGSLFTLTALQLLAVDEQQIRAQLQTQAEQAADFFKQAPIIIELQKVSDSKQLINFASLSALLREFEFIPVGVRGGNEAQTAAAMAAGLAQLANTKTTAKETQAMKKQAALQSKSKLITQPVRSGQQVYAKGGDLIVMGPVSAGAELLADGHIHVYGPLRGRALAGIGGDKTARIFCRSLAAELVSIAGHYWVSEDLKVPLDRREWVQIYLEEERLRLGLL